MTDHSALIERLDSHMGKADISEVLADCRKAAAALRDLTEWRDIATAPKDGTIIQRPHTTWGAMSVRHKRPDQSEDSLRGYSWMSADYSNLWPENAFLPLWLPLPSAPNQAKEAGKP